MRTSSIGAVPRRVRRRRASGATTPEMPDSVSSPAVRDDPQRLGGGRARRSPGSRSRAGGASSSRPSSTAPPGPNLKTQWTKPITWSQDWRDRAYAVPARRRAGDAHDRLLLRRDGAGSRLLWRAVDNPLPTCVGGAGGARRCGHPASARATWRPAAPLRLARRRAWGQVLTAAARMYVGASRLFLGIGLCCCRSRWSSRCLQARAARRHRSSSASTIEGAAAGFFVLVAITIGSTLTWLGLGHRPGGDRPGDGRDGRRPAAGARPPRSGWRRRTGGCCGRSRSSSWSRRS